MKNNFITKIIGATLAFAMMVGGAVGINAIKEAKEVDAADNDVSISENTKGANYTGTNFDVSSGGLAASSYFKLGSATLTSKSSYNLDATKTISYSITTRKFGGPSAAQALVSLSLKNGSNTVATASYSPTSTSLTAYNGTFTITGDTSDVKFVIKGNGEDGGDKGVGISAISFTATSAGGQQATYSVTYLAGGATSGTVPTDNNEYESGDSVTVLGNTGNLTKEDYEFGGWTDGENNYSAGDTFEITDNVNLTAVWNENIDDGAVTYNLNQMSNFASWGTGYSDHSHTFNVSENETAVVTIKSSNHQTNTITDVPVSKGGDVAFVLNSDARYIKNITFHARQWQSKAQTMTLYTSTNGGTSYTNTEITSTNFKIRGTNFVSGTNAVKVTFNSKDNQVGYVDFVVTYDNLPAQQATAMTISPASLSLYGGDDGAFTPTLSGGQGDYKKTITWESSHPSIIAAPADSEAGEVVHVTPAEVASDTDVTITGTVDVQNGASASIVITVKLIKTISVNHVEISGIENNSTLNGSNDNTFAINRTIQLSASVVYNQGNEYMDGNNGISWSSSDTDVATVSSAGLVTLCGNGEVTITATSTEDGNKSASLSFTISNINSQLGTQDNPFTVQQAIAAIDANGTINNAHVKGIISRIDSFNSGAITYWISDDGTTSNQLEAYKGKNTGGANFASVDDIELGASVVIKGNLVKYNNTIYEFEQNNRIISYADPSEEIRLNNYLNTASSVMSINATENRTSYVEPETIVFADLGLTNGVQYSDPFNGGHFTITFAGGENDGKYYTTGSGIRSYASGTITIASAEPISQIEFTWSGNNKPQSNEVVEVGEYDDSSSVWSGDANSVVLTNPSNGSQWRLQSVTVTYGRLDSVTNLKLRFGASISVEKWNAINALEGYEITDYGVMLFKTREQYAETAPTVQNLYNTNPAYVEVFSKGSGVAPTAEDEKYIFTARIDYSNEDEYSKYIIAQAFIVVNGERHFVGAEMRASVRSLAGTANVNTNLSPDALTYLTTAGN